MALRRSPSAGATGVLDETAVRLAVAARAGDRSAWHELVDHCLPLVWRVAAAQGLGTRDCGDAVQLTWLRLLEDQGPHFTDAARLEEWLVTTSRLESQRIVLMRRSAAEGRSRRCGAAIGLTPDRLRSAPG